MTVCSKASLRAAQQAILQSVRREKWIVDELDPKVWPEERCALPMERWRQNVVVEGVAEAFGEDAWEGIEIGPSKHLIYCVARCARCSESLWLDWPGRRRSLKIGVSGAKHRPCHRNS